MSGYENFIKWKLTKQPRFDYTNHCELRNIKENDMTGWELLNAGNCANDEVSTIIVSSESVKNKYDWVECLIYWKLCKRL